jgi:hypothetical protein
MRMRWLAAGLAIGGILGAIVPVVAFTPLFPASFQGIRPGGDIVVGCVDAAGAYRPGTQVGYTAMSLTGWAQMTCPL